MSGVRVADEEGASASVTKGFISELDGLRGIAVSLVIFHHFWPTTGWLARYERLGELGWIGVDLFFVISGFLITGILLDTRGRPAYFKNFYARRALRIFPLYYVFLAVVLVTPFTQPGAFSQTPFIQSSGSPLWYIFYLGNFPEALLGKVDPPFLLAPLWSLAIEEQFYISWPSVVAAVNPRRIWQVLVGLVVFAPLFRFVTMLLFPANERVQYLFTLSRVDVIAIGALVAVALRSERFQMLTARTAAGARARRFVTFAAMAAAVTFVTTYRLGGLDRLLPFGRVAGYSIVAATFATFLLWALLHRGSAVTSPLRFAGLRYLGKICYGLYLLHRPASIIVDKVLARAHIEVDASSLSLIALKCVVSVALASVSWFAFERPILKLKDAFASKGHPADAPAPSSPVPPLRAAPDASGPLRMSP